MTPRPQPEPEINEQSIKEYCMNNCFRFAYIERIKAEAARAATIAERQKWIDALNTLISTESVRLSPTMVNMTYREAAVLAVADEPVEP